MSIFDPPNETKLDELYPDSEPFILYAAEFEGVKNTTFGPSAQALVTAGPADKTGEPEEYRVFGALADAIRNIEGSDLPSLVCIKMEGRRKTWSKIETSTEDIPF